MYAWLEFAVSYLFLLLVDLKKKWCEIIYRFDEFFEKYST